MQNCVRMYVHICSCVYIMMVCNCQVEQQQQQQQPSVKPVTSTTSLPSADSDKGTPERHRKKHKVCNLHYIHIIYCVPMP